MAAFEASLEDALPTVKPDHLRARPGLGFSTGGDRESIRLRAHDEALIAAVAAANERTVVVIPAGSAVVMTDRVESVSAVAQAWYGGQQAERKAWNPPTGRYVLSVARNATDQTARHVPIDL